MFALFPTEPRLDLVIMLFLSVMIESTNIKCLIYLKRGKNSTYCCKYLNNE